MLGYIYICKCNITNKCYIGQTTQDYKRRWADHWKESNNSKSVGYNFHFHKALRKYGKDAFKWKILTTIEAESLDELQCKLDDLEVKYIQEYDSYNNGYNSTLGGEHSAITPKKLSSYTDSGELLLKFNNVEEASCFYNISKSVIWNNCGRFSLYTTFDNKRICFRWDEDPFNENDLLQLKNIHYDTGVTMYDINGTLVNEFSSLKIVADTLNIKSAKITTNCRKKSSFVLINQQRYIFRYTGDFLSQEDLNKAQYIKCDPKRNVIAIDSITNEVIGEYESMSIAGRVLNVRKNNISEAASGKRKTAGKYNGHPIIWKYKPMV